MKEKDTFFKSSSSVMSPSVHWTSRIVLPNVNKSFWKSKTEFPFLRGGSKGQINSKLLYKEKAAGFQLVLHYQHLLSDNKDGYMGMPNPVIGCLSYYKVITVAKDRVDDRLMQKGKQQG